MFNKAMVMLAALSALTARLPSFFKAKKETPKTLMHEASGDWWSDNSSGRRSSASGGNKGQHGKILRARAKKIWAIFQDGGTEYEQSQENS